MRIWKYTFLTLSLVLILFGIAMHQMPDSNLHIIACDVGQGDAILVTYKNIQILTDGGPDSSVLDCLGRHIPFWDRRIELIVSTHSDSDHSTGLIDVIKRYNVVTLLISPIDSGTQVYRLLEKEVGSHGVGVVNPDRGMGIRLDMIYLDIVYPSVSELSKLTIKNPEGNMDRYQGNQDINLYSIVYKLSFKNFNGLFTGDIPREVSDSLAESKSVEKVNYIKIPHHGSSNGLTNNLLKAVVPKIAVISLGVKNMWGFPTPEILQMLSDNNVKVLRTDQMGDVEVVTDGGKYWWKK